MTMEDKRVRLEVWPVAADEHGFWLLSGGDALRGGDLGADQDEHAEVAVLLQAAECWPPAVVHSTSWRGEGPTVLLTYIAALIHDPILASWPKALPISPELLPTVGNPLPHGPVDRPQPRRVDVLHHALRHLTFLRAHDAGVSAALIGYWPRHLDILEPALAGLYSEVAQ